LLLGIMLVIVLGYLPDGLTGVAVPAAWRARLHRLVQQRPTRQRPAQQPSAQQPSAQQPSAKQGPGS
jgi:hypothetical protein